MSNKNNLPRPAAPLTKKKEKFLEMLKHAVTIHDLEKQAQWLIDAGAIRLEEIPEESTFLDVYPVAVALLRNEADRIAYGASSAVVNRNTNKKAKKIQSYLK